MPRVNNNADDYANARIGLYFTANQVKNNLESGSLDGQCVTAVKHFLYNMTDVPNAGVARGHAKDYGDTLVREGHATVVSEADRRRGDIVVWKQDGGGYGHIGVLLSGDRVFEQNVGIVGTPSKLVNGAVENSGKTIMIRVFATRISPLYQNWRVGKPTFYRVKSYSEGNNSEGGQGNSQRGKDFLKNSGLGINQGIRSLNNVYNLVMQGDGNLVLYKDDKWPIWSSNTIGSGAVSALMQNDGNFVLYTRNGTPVWSSDTARGGGDKIIVQNDGNLVIYRPNNTSVWSTK